MSSEKESENLSRQKPKVSQARFVLLGLAGPKPRPKGVGDGQPVDIPAPRETIKTRWGDVIGCASARLDWRVLGRGCPVGKSAGGIPELGGVESSDEANWCNR